FQWIRGELIGKGNYGRVYMALNASTGEVMAVKQVEVPHHSEKTSQQKEIIDALKFEGETLENIEHPNIVQFLGYEESQDCWSMFLEYVPGGTIESCLRRHGPFSEELTKSFTSQMLRGLDYLHNGGIMHRDLKSANILVEQAGVCKISDFGVSKHVGLLESQIAHTGLKGTVYWMAPEVVNSHKAGYDLKVDIWSVGCIVLEMWTGKRPWYGEEAVPVMLKLYTHQSAPPLPPNHPQLSPLASDFRERCFMPQPSERPTAAELLEHPYLVPDPEWSFT
ncbi:kinase-like protein, partial [Cylindrobasidium torrendii FP15055 ss-10]